MDAGVLSFGDVYPEIEHRVPQVPPYDKGRGAPTLTLNSSRNLLQSSADLARISSSRWPTGMGKYFLGPEGDLLRSITLCCSVGSKKQEHLAFLDG